MPPRADLARAALPLLDRGDRALERLAGAVGDASRTLRFLRGRAAFEPRDSDVYVASYPRSGTTWTQVLVHLIVSGDERFDFEHIADVSPWWERSLAHRRDAADELAALPAPRVLKTHLPYRWLPTGARYLYVWRNPADVAVSYYHLYRRYLRFDAPFTEFFHRFLRGDVQYRSWFRHMAGWQAESSRPRVLLVPYDDMRADTASWVRDIADFLEVPISAARADAIAGCADFASMKSEETKFDHVGELCRQWGIRSGAFLREGVVTRGDGRLTDEQREALERARTRPVAWPSIEWRLPDFLH